MSLESTVRPLALLARVLDLLQPLFALIIPWYVSWQFLKSGWLNRFGRQPRCVTL